MVWTLEDVRESHKEAVLNGFEWDGERPAEPDDQFQGQAVFSRAGFKMFKEGQRVQKEEYRVGTHVTIHLPSMPPPQDGSSAKGEAYAPSVARITAIFEDAHGSCHVALHYFWRWGQIHAGADLHPATRPRHRSQIWLQAEVTEKDCSGPCEAPNRNAVKYPDGSWRDVLPAIYINHCVVVLHQQQVEQHYGSLDAYEANFCEVNDDDTGTRDNGFWYNATFDHTCYKFACVPPQASSPAPVVQRLPGSCLTMGDVFCGLGTVAVAANTVGFQVGFGIDSHPSAISSFLSNTAPFMGAPLNTQLACQPKAVLKKVQQVVADLEADAAAGRALRLQPVDYLHFSPPCQDLSQKKKLLDRTTSGAELRCVVSLARLLRPTFITLEEVPGFLVQRFLPHNLRGPLAGWPNPPQEEASAAGTCPSAGGGGAGGGDSAGDSDDGSDDGDGGYDDDLEGEGSGDLDEPDDNLEALGQQQQGTAAAAGAAGEGTSSAAAAAAAGSGVLFNPCLLVIPQLLDLGYQLRLTLLNAADYGVPQIRWRVVLLAAKQGYQLPAPPAPRYALPQPQQQPQPQQPDQPRQQQQQPAQQRPRGPHLPAKDTNFQVKEGEAREWPVTLMLEVQHPDRLLPHITLQEAIGDLPPLMAGPTAAAAGDDDGGLRHSHRHERKTQQPETEGHSNSRSGPGQQQQQRGGQKGKRQLNIVLGEQVMRYEPERAVLPCLLPLEGCAPVSRYSTYMRRPHAPHQQRRSLLQPELLQHHSVSHSGAEVGRLLALPDRKLAGESPADAAKRNRAGHRLAADGLSACILGHNEPRRTCLHFSEDRMLTLAERRRLQSLPDWLAVEGRSLKEMDQQVGNAVPSLMAMEVAATVWEAATGAAAVRPPALNGPCDQGTGITDSAARQCYTAWLQQVGWAEVLQASRQLLQEKARDIQQQQHLQHLQLRAAAAAQGQESGQQEQQRRGGGQQQQQQQQQPNGQQRRPPACTDPAPLCEQPNGGTAAARRLNGSSRKRTRAAGVSDTTSASGSVQPLQHQQQ